MAQKRVFSFPFFSLGAVCIFSHTECKHIFFFFLQGDTNKLIKADFDMYIMFLRSDECLILTLIMIFFIDNTR